MLSTLPTEVLERIVAYVGSNDLYASTSPHPSGADLDHKLPLSSDRRKDLLSLALAGTWLHKIARSALYRTIHIRTRFSFLLFADAISLSSLDDENETAPTSRAASIRAVMLRDKWAHHAQVEWSTFRDRLRSFFDHATQLDVVALESDPVSSVFLNIRTICRPRRVTLALASKMPQDGGFNADAYAPLSEATHLRFLNATAALSFIRHLVSEADAAKQLSLCGSLQCLRLSHLCRCSLHGFASWIERNKQMDEHEEDSAYLQPGLVDPGVLLQSSLSILARYSDRLPHFRLLLLDFRASQHPPLRFPFQWEDYKDASPKDTLRRDAQTKAAFEPRRAQPADAHYFHEAMRTVQGLSAKRVPNVSTSDAARQYEEMPHTFSLDEFWREMEAGKHAYERLLAEKSDRPPELRIVQGNQRIVQGNHKKAKAYPLDEIDFYCQTGPGADDADVGCWADPDVFHLVTRSPYLSYRLHESGTGWYWTGELPRSTTRDGVTTYIPCWVPIDPRETSQ
ncbi:hypothetical protein PANT_7c00043 [Moesziomyces antarcticus T-34]|uniref:F-box domain-containing protein n=1 Tax=Pseudozyma antarctica (strain T-34) TaxID=1151754 RepID=M9LLD7_PSEA3|nr:hypothetical protein PANT_7c00043 [Moesziomyces antarcticus T-34]